MIEPRKGLPPHIALLLNEDFLAPTPEQARKKLRSMIPELKDQVLAGDIRDTLPDFRPDPSRFHVVLSGGLDLFADEGACSKFRCRVEYAHQIARSIALMADEVTVHDFFAERILAIKRATNEDLHKLLADIFVLQWLKPLIAAGLLSFRSPLLPVCTHCIRYFDDRVDALTETVVAEFGPSIIITRLEDGTAEVDTGPMYEPPVGVVATGNLAKITDEMIRRQVVHQCIRTALWDARNAAFVGGAVFSNSKLGLTGVLAEEGRFDTRENLRAFEGHRAGRLPWVGGLSIPQTLQLREEAHEALPALREFLAKNLAARLSDARGSSTPDDYLAELRSQAADVASELKIATSRRSSLAKNALGILSLGVCAYGITSEKMTAAEGLAQLLTTLGVLGSHTTPAHQTVEKLKSKPGYVLVAAESILAHAHANHSS